MTPPYAEDEVVDIDRALDTALRHLGLNGLELVGDGLESCVFRAHGAGLGDVVVRVPRYTHYRLPQREPFSALTNLNQEYVICRELHRAGFPVAEPLSLVADLPVPVLVSRFVQAQGHGAPPDLIGRMLARLHTLPLPPITPLDHDGTDLVVAMSNRLFHRWRRLHELIEDLPSPPPLMLVRKLLQPAGTPHVRLLHLDVRACNILSANGRVAALVDWSCAMFGHPAAELARVQENAQLPENGLDPEGIFAGYMSEADLPRVSPTLDALLRLDAVVMLASLFLEYVPDEERAAWATARARELAAQVHDHYGSSCG